MDKNSMATCPKCNSYKNTEVFIGSKSDDYGIGGNYGAYAGVSCFTCEIGVDLYSDSTMIETDSKNGLCYATNEFGRWIIKD